MARSLQLLGLGNALVDIEFTVRDEELRATGLRKGGMTLVDSAAQQTLLHTLLLNHRGRLSSGGSAANTIVAFAQFGGTGGYMSALGQDEHGDFFAGEFAQLGIALFAERITNEPTGTCVVLVTEDGERTMQTCLAASDCFNRAMLDRRAIEHAEWLYVEGYKLTSPHGAEAAREAIYLARKEGVRVALSFSDAFVVTSCREHIKFLLHEVDMVFCNDREACAYFDTDNPNDAFAELCGQIPNVVFTLGPHGSMVRVEGVQARIPAYPTTVVDTNGAGDMYAGAFLYGLLHGWGVERSGHAASSAAAQIVAQYGARYHGDHRRLIGNGLDVQRIGESVVGNDSPPNPARSSPREFSSDL
ncbi:MAG: adenosine kinase [Candidatus Kapaibacterium sp.]|nr:MAG: adenosine kinase [Candidatus Kapabacteria bacterium]